MYGRECGLQLSMSGKASDAELLQLLDLPGIAGGGDDRRNGQFFDLVIALRLEQALQATAVQKLIDGLTGVGFEKGAHLRDEIFGGSALLIDDQLVFALLGKTRCLNLSGCGADGAGGPCRTTRGEEG